MASTPRAGFSRWLRATSEKYLMQAAVATLAERYRGRVPPPPRGVTWLWVRIYAPVYHWLPLPLRTAVIARLPGSHRQKWTYRSRPRGPAV